MLASTMFLFCGYLLHTPYPSLILKLHLTEGDRGLACGDNLAFMSRVTNLVCWPPFHRA